MKMRRRNSSFLVAMAVLFAWSAFVSAASGGQALKDPAVRKSFEEAKAKLQAGVNTWNRDVSKEARDLLIGCLMRTQPENAYLDYYVGLADFWLASYAIASEETAECGRMAVDGQKYLEKALALDPAFAEAEALYGYLIGMQVAAEPEQAMTLGLKSMQHIEKALAAEPDNPRIQFLKGFYQLYLPEMFGGGADNALPYFEKAIELFDKEKITDPMKPSWGKDVNLLNTALVYKNKKNEAKAVELLKKALAANPDYWHARYELDQLEKKEPT